MGCKVNDLCFLNETIQTANESLVHRVLLNIVVSICGTRELNDKSMSYAILEMCWLHRSVKLFMNHLFHDWLT